MDKETYSEIYIIGDSHGDYRGLDTLCAKMPDNSLIVHVGDWGLGFMLGYLPTETLKNIQENLKEKNSKIYVIHGNHDNYDLFDSVNGNIHYLKDYTYKNINNKTWLFVGGATSIDRHFRTENNNWWPNEVFVLDRDKCKDECDVLITHSAPWQCFPHDTESRLRTIVKQYNNGLNLAIINKLVDDLREERMKLGELFYLTNPKQLYYGHFHTSKAEFIEGCYCRLLDINEIETFKEER